jgi:hypothetical protein
MIRSNILEVAGSMASDYDDRERWRIGKVTDNYFSPRALVSNNCDRYWFLQTRKLFRVELRVNIPRRDR